MFGSVFSYTMRQMRNSEMWHRVLCGAGRKIKMPGQGRASRLFSEQLLAAGYEVGESLAGEQSVGKQSKVNYLMEQVCGAFAVSPDLGHNRVFHIDLDIVHLRHRTVEVHTSTD